MGKFNENFRRLLKASGMTQREFQKKTGISQTNISHWVTSSDYGKSPSLKYLLVIAKTLKVSLDELVGLETDDLILTEHERRLCDNYRNLPPDDPRRLAVDVLLFESKPTLQGKKGDC